MGDALECRRVLVAPLGTQLDTRKGDLSVAHRGFDLVAVAWPVARLGDPGVVCACRTVSVARDGGQRAPETVRKAHRAVVRDGVGGGTSSPP